MTREEAIELIGRMSMAFVPTDQYGDCADPEPYETAVNMAIEALSADTDMSEYCDRLWKIAYERGKAEAVQGWIPVSERLPEEYGEYLVTKRTIGWNCEEYGSNDIAYFDSDGFHKADKVTAWMPLPEPYKGGEADEID